VRRDDKALYCGSLYLSTYTPILCCDFLSITGNFGACGNSQDSRTQLSPLGWPKKVLIMFPATFSLLFYWFRWINWTKNNYNSLLHFLPILELIPYSSNSRFRFMVRTLIEVRRCLLSTSTESIGCQLWLSCGWTSTELLSGSTLVT
jgi:hypothetical protein